VDFLLKVKGEDFNPVAWADLLHSHFFKKKIFHFLYHINYFLTTFFTFYITLNIFYYHSNKILTKKQKFSLFIQKIYNIPSTLYHIKSQQSLTSNPLLCQTPPEKILN
jgi:hypothetical protein